MAAIRWGPHLWWGFAAAGVALVCWLHGCAWRMDLHSMMGRGTGTGCYGAHVGVAHQPTKTKAWCSGWLPEPRSPPDSDHHASLTHPNTHTRTQDDGGDKKRARTDKGAKADKGGKKGRANEDEEGDMSEDLDEDEEDEEGESGEGAYTNTP
jgi:hypothetical protein